MLTREQTQAPHAGQRPLEPDEAHELAREVPRWTLHQDHLEREFQFADFDEAMAFVLQVAEVARETDHHPDIHVNYNRVRLELSTHKIGGLSRNDFIVAARIDQLLQDR